MDINFLLPDVLKLNGINSFKSNLIFESLIRETSISSNNARIITENTLRFLISTRKKIKIITSPMIREIVNTELLQNNLELERLKYTRIGFPKYDLNKIYNKNILNLEYSYCPKFWLLEQELNKEIIEKKIINHIQKEYNAVNKLIKKLEESI